MQEVKFGDVTANRVVEYHGDAGTAPETSRPASPSSCGGRTGHGFSPTT
jgi:hypothetical protein